MSAQKYLPGLALPAHYRPHRRDRVAQAGAIAFGVPGKRRSKTPLLPKGKIAPQNGVAMSAESLGERDKQRGVAIAARAVSQNQCISPRIVRRVHPSAHMRINILIEE
jgi:hypothetical protein